MTEFAKLVLAVDSTTAKSSKTDLDNLTESGKKAEGQFGNLKNAAVAVGAALTAAAAAGAALVKAQIDAADAASKAASAAGVSVEQYTRLSYALKLGVDGGGDLSQTFLFLNKAIASGSDAFDSIGVSTRNADGSFRSADAVMLDVSDKFRLMEDGATKTAIAVELFGRSGDSMIPVLNGGSQALREAAAEADRLGVTLDTSTAVAAENFNDNLTRLESGALGFGNSLMSSTLPALNSVAEALLDDTSALNDTARAVAAAGAAYVAVTIAMNAKVIALRAATLAQTAFNTAAKANPYAIAAAGLGLLVAAVYNYNKAMPEAIKRTEEASTAMSRFDAITRRAKDAIDAQNRSAAGMTLPQLKQQVDSVSASIEHLEVLHKRAAADFARGAVSSGLVATYDAQLTEKRKQLDHLNALIGEKIPEIKSSAAATAPSRTVQQQPVGGAPTTAAGAVAAPAVPLGPTDEDILAWLEKEGQAQAQVEALRQGFRDMELQADAKQAQAKMQQQSQFMGDMMSLMNSKSKTLFNIGKAAAVANALLKAKESVVNAYTFGSGIGGPVLGAVFGGIAAVAQAANIAAIKGQSFGGGGGVSSAGGGGGGGIVPMSSENVGTGIIQQAAPRQQTTDIRLTGIRPDDMITGSYLQKIIEGIGETLADNGGKMGRVELVTA